MSEPANRSLETPQILHDEPLRDEDDAYFHFDDFAITLARLVADRDTRTPLTIGVSGAWGSGKTTLLRRVRRMLDKPVVDGGHQFAGTTPPERFRACKTVWFNAWKYRQEDELLAALVRVIVKSMRKGKVLEKLNAVLEDPEQPCYDFPAMFLNSLKVDFGVVGIQVDPSKFKAESPIKSHTAFFDHFDESFERLLALWVHGKPEKAIDERRGALVVFIDDLDRCLPDKTVQVLEAVKLFVDKQGCIFVIGADTRIVQDAVKKYYADKSLTGENADEYLEKVIQLRFSLPPIQQEKMDGFVKQQITEESPLYKHWKTIVTGAEGNPRKVKTFLNDVNLRWAMWKNSGEGANVDYDVYVSWEVLMRSSGRFRERLYGIQPTTPGHYQVIQDTLDNAFRWAGGEQEAAASFKEDVNEQMRRVLLEIAPYQAQLTKLESLQSLMYLADLAQPEEKAAEESEAVPIEKGKRAPAEAHAREEAPGAEAPSGRLVIGNEDFSLEFLRIPAGRFLIGSGERDSTAYDNEKPQHTLDLPDTWMARFPVTVTQFAAFAAANPEYKTTAEKQGSGYAFTGSKWEEVKGAYWKAPRGPESSIAQKGDHPVTQVSWEDAMACCRWLYDLFKKQLPATHILRLPTEAEWEKAARGAAGNLYPWGNEAPDEKRCNFNMNVKDTTPVGQYSPQGDSPYGCADMSGNAWEWTHSLYKAYPYEFNDGREKENASGPRVLRGGSFDCDAWSVRCAYRGYLDPYSRVDYLGFRLCVSPISLISEL
ncbi:MAG: SUMF1/EgtB/PvdO family nonheme iron enzyme [Chloroflexota bacterium]